MLIREHHLEDLLRFAADTAAQAAGGRLTLTLLDVEQIVGEGSPDLVGEPGKEARRIKRPARRVSSDDRGRWDLVQGVYWVTYNERVEIPTGCILYLQPHMTILRNGLWHPSILVRDWDEDVPGMLLTVAARGVRLFEGAVITAGFVFEPGDQGA